jgi:hypothetical protein
VVLGVALLSSTKLIVVVPLKEDKDDRYGSEAIESGFIFQIIRSGNEKENKRRL